MTSMNVVEEKITHRAGLRLRGADRGGDQAADRGDRRQAVERTTLYQESHVTVLAVCHI